MKYVCMGYHNEAQWAAMNEAERAALVEENMAYLAQLRKNGHFLDGIALQPTQTATTLRFEGGRMAVTDGPFAETKEQLGGAMVVDAVDLNQAIQLMSQLPCMRVNGSLEIRPLNENLTA